MAWRARAGLCFATLVLAPGAPAAAQALVHDSSSQGLSGGAVAAATVEAGGAQAVQKAAAAHPAAPTPLQGSWAAYNVLSDASMEEEVALLSDITLSKYTYKYDRKGGRRLLGVLPAHLETLRPAAVARTTMPVLLPNGTTVRMEGFPVVDWTPLFMASIAGAQALHAQITDMTGAVERLEVESTAFTRRLIEVMDAQGREWQSAAALRSAAAAAESEADLIRAKVEAARERGGQAAALAAARAAAAADAREAERASAAAVAARRAELSAAGASARARAARASDARLEAERRVMEMAAIDAAARADAAAAAAAADTRRAAAAAHARESAAAARANEGLTLARIAAQGAADRERAAAVISELFALAGAAAASALSNPADAARGAGALLAAAAAALIARAAARVAAEAAEARFARPALVRETTRAAGAWWEAAGWLVPGLAALRAAWQRRRRRQQGTPTSSGDGDGGGDGEEGWEGVVLGDAVGARVRGLVEGVRGARGRGAPLRNVLLHGPPGTGKTLVARRVAELCGVDFAVMSGGDLAPLGNDAVSALHRLLEWARSSARGMALVIDEAEACAGDRRRAGLGEAALNCLNTLLYHTSEASSRFMLILTSSRPADLEEAILDRMDDVIELPLPAPPQRRRLCSLFYNLHVEGHSAARAAAAPRWRRLLPWHAPRQGLIDTSGFAYDAAAAEELVTRSEGLSGRDLSKLMLAVQAAAYGSEACALTPALWRATVGWKLNEYAAKQRGALPGAGARRTSRSLGGGDDSAWRRSGGVGAAPEDSASSSAMCSRELF